MILVFLKTFKLPNISSEYELRDRCEIPSDLEKIEVVIGLTVNTGGRTERQTDKRERRQ